MTRCIESVGDPCREGRQHDVPDVAISFVHWSHPAGRAISLRRSLTMIDDKFYAHRNPGRQPDERDAKEVES
jgi:hypothetical protein